MMEITGISGNSSIYQFGHHTYAPGGPVGIREVPFELFSVSRQLDLRDKPLDFESQPFPHQLLPNYTQTILLPITIKNISAEGSPESSRCTTPDVVPEPKIDTKNEDYIEAPSPPQIIFPRILSADVVGKSDGIVADDRKIYSADCVKREKPSGKYFFPIFFSVGFIII